MANEQLWASTLQKTNLWVKELAAELGLGLEDTLLAFRTITHALRDRLPVTEAVQLAAQLPLVLKGVYFDGWKPSRTPVKIRTKHEFFEWVSPQLLRGIRKVDVEDVSRAVLRFLARHISEGEIHQIRGIMPEELRELWPDEASRVFPQGAAE